MEQVLPNTLKETKQPEDTLPYLTEKYIIRVLPTDSMHVILVKLANALRQDNSLHSLKLLNEIQKQWETYLAVVSSANERDYSFDTVQASAMIGTMFDLIYWDKVRNPEELNLKWFGKPKGLQKPTNKIQFPEIDMAARTELETCVAIQRDRGIQLRRQIEKYEMEKPKIKILQDCYDPIVIGLDDAKLRPNPIISIADIQRVKESKQQQFEEGKSPTNTLYDYNASSTQSLYHLQLAVLQYLSDVIQGTGLVKDGTVKLAKNLLLLFSANANQLVSDPWLSNQLSYYHDIIEQFKGMTSVSTSAFLLQDFRLKYQSLLEYHVYVDWNVRDGHFPQQQVFSNFTFALTTDGTSSQKFIESFEKGMKQTWEALKMKSMLQYLREFRQCLQDLVPKILNDFQRQLDELSKTAALDPRCASMAWLNVKLDPKDTKPVLLLLSPSHSNKEDIQRRYEQMEFKTMKHYLEYEFYSAVLDDAKKSLV